MGKHILSCCRVLLTAWEVHSTQVLQLRLAVRAWVAHKADYVLSFHVSLLVGAGPGFIRLQVMLNIFLNARLFSFTSLNQIGKGLFSRACSHGGTVHKGV